MTGSSKPDVTPARSKARRDGENSRRRQEILEVAARCFAKQGYEATTVRDIAAEAGILSGSLYHHFVSKDDILHQIIRPHVDTMLKSYREIGAREDEAIHVLEQLIRFNLSHLLTATDAQKVTYFERHLFRNSEEFSYVRDFYEEINEMFVQTLKRSVEEGSISGDFDIKLVEVFILRFIASMIDPPELLKGKSKKSIADAVVAFVMKAVKAQ